MTEKPSLIEQVRQCVRLKHYSSRTEQAYAQWIRRFILFHEKRHPSAMGADEIRHYLSHLAVGGASRRRLRRRLSRHYSSFTARSWGVELPYVEGIERAERPARVPVVLTREEAEHILSHVRGTYRLMASLLYGAGLRLMGGVRLRVKDFDLGYRQITVRDGRGRSARAFPVGLICGSKLTLLMAPLLVT